MWCKPTLSSFIFIVNFGSILINLVYYWHFVFPKRRFPKQQGKGKQFSNFLQNESSSIFFVFLPGQYVWRLVKSANLSLTDISSFPASGNAPLLNEAVRGCACSPGNLLPCLHLCKPMALNPVSIWKTTWLLHAPSSCQIYIYFPSIWFPPSLHVYIVVGKK